MKDDFKSLEIEPKEGYLDFIGPAKLHSTAQSKVLKGHVRFTLIRPTKIRTMSVKFKGFSNITLKQPYNIEMTCPLLPKLKVPLFGKANFPAGDHVIPWELDIPNIYPRSLLAKRATIHYKVIVSISTGIARTLTAEYPVVLKRHLLPYKELSPLIETKLYQRTVPGKFHYEIDAPQIVCIEQEYIPMAIKYVSIANQKPVQSIRTRVVQIELYRRQSLSKSESDLTTSNRDSHIFDLDKKIADFAQYKDTHIKYIKRTIPALIHLPDASTSAWKRPCLIRHNLHPYLSYTLDSPLVSIYHQIEITFQFGMKYEEIKTKLPIIIASIPRKDPTQTQLVDQKSSNLMMKYAFEETARSEFLRYEPELRKSANHITDDDHSNLNDDSFSVLRDTSMMPITSDEEDSVVKERTMGGRTTPLMFVTGNPSRARSPMPAVNTCMTNTSNIIHRRLLSPTPESSSILDVNSNQRQLKKFASAFDLSTASEESPQIDAEREPEERPRTTTPTMKRSHMHRKQLQPINVDLANGKETNLFKSMPFNRLPPQTTLPPPPVSQKSASSDVLPTLDRMQHQQQIRKNARQQHPPFESVAATAMDDASNDDLQSIYSESSLSSSHNAPSLSSSATLSTNKSQPTLHSRPPSPVFSPAPGLPATIALRPHGEGVQAVEEMFPPDSASIMSPAMNTVASSTLFSPRTTYALQRRIALSTISSLTNDSLQLGPSMLSPNNMRGRTSSTVDPDIQSLMHSSFCSSSFGSFDYPPPPPNNRYANAQLPPIPTNAASLPPLPPLPTTTTNADNTTVKANRRLTRLYIDDSDEEDYIDRGDGVRSPSPPPLPQIPTNIKSYTAAHSNYSNMSDDSEIKDESAISAQDDCAPPRLPRLSFGNDFGISLGI
ncbi:uncharacterized protein ATC70_001452 [Mucor velutinosus]|uniref:Arrestin C-terminal-like domain-containing protein n=1 Tax=Mucor velutinosus TaxID=708070 RepID=A0AAN7DII5_9FUNG|nr:hypothetical protein ATC70_001452 [Mucor velutinosus]